MKARLRIIVAACVLLTAGVPTLAQEASSPPQNEVVGPPQLRDFTLNGTVTRPAPPPASEQPRQDPPPQTRPAPAPRTVPQAAGPASPADTGDASSPPIVRPQPTETEFGNLPPPPPPEPSLEASETATPPQPQDSSESLPNIPILPWILVALAAAGAAAWFLLRQRQRASYAGAGDIDRFEAPPAPAREPPVKAPAQPEPETVATGVVSTRLRPWLEIEFTPQRGIIDNEKAAIGFELSVYNSGSVPARDVVILVALVNGGPAQDQQIRLFYENAAAQQDNIPVIPPLQRITVNSNVVLVRDQIRPIAMEGRQLFVPMVAFNILYRWSGGAGQTCASYLVGKQTTGEKLAPFRLDLGSRIFRNLAAREHELRVRK